MDSIKNRILFEDNHLIVINKNVKELVQSDITNDITLAEKVKDYLKKTYNKQGNVFLGIPHRLDRPTSGIVIYTKTDKALSRMCNAFRENTVKKTYWAIVDAAPDQKEATITHYLTRDTTKNKSFATLEKKKNSKIAKLSYKLIGASKSFYLLEIDLHTGRHHQIRAQLAAMNIHIRGDLKYGFPRSNKDGGISLHAREVEFMHPVKKEKIKIVAPPPKEVVWDYFVNSITDLT
ncbi:MAG: RluA family pseudouridine synthase [Pleomorphochaeta sp.]